MFQRKKEGIFHGRSFSTGHTTYTTIMLLVCPWANRELAGRVFAIHSKRSTTRLATGNVAYGTYRTCTTLTCENPKSGLL
jgi:hypothetical protein